MRQLLEKLGNFKIKKQGMESLFVPYEIALALKELGFDEPCFGYFDPLLGEYVIMNSDCINPKPTLFNHNLSSIVVSAPLYQQAFRWFREKYDLCAYVVTAPNYIKGESKYKTRFSYAIYGMNEKSSSTVFISIRDAVNLSTHEEAELECLIKLIEIVKENK
jgi:hypothetical protein